MNTIDYDPQLLLDNLMGNMGDRIYFKDLESRFVFVNRAVLSWHGVDRPEQLLGKSDEDLFPSAVARRNIATEQRIISTGQSLTEVVESELRPDGEMAWVSTAKTALRASDGTIVGTFGMSRDITVQKESELRAAHYAEQIRRIKEEMEAQVAMAAELQATFFPHQYPVFPVRLGVRGSAVEFGHCYRASGMISGDFCAIRKRSSTECALLLCDVMGHGIRAALGNALIYAMVAELMEQEADPGVFLARMNQLLMPILRQEDTFLYATAIYVVFDAATGRLRYANAGHPAPLVLAGEGAACALDEAIERGPALAIMEDAEYPVMDRVLRPGDAVVLFTDGIYEVAGDEGEEYGEERLQASARRHGGKTVPDLLAALLDDAVDFSAEGSFEDDVCLAGFKYLARMEPNDE